MKNKTIKVGVLVLGLTVLGSSEMFGQSEGKGDRKEPPTFAELIKELDANEDGKLAKNEVKGPLKDMYKKIDTDEDGFISEEEFKKAPKPKRQAK